MVHQLRNHFIVIIWLFHLIIALLLHSMAIFPMSLHRVFVTCWLILPDSVLGQLCQEKSQWVHTATPLIHLDGFDQVDGCQYPKDGNSTFIDCVTQHARSASSSQCGIRYNAEIIEIILGVLGFIALVGILGILAKVIQDKCRSTTPFCCSREKITIVAGKLVEEEPYRALREVA